MRAIRLPFNIPGYNGLAGTWPLPPLVSKDAPPRVDGNEMVHWWAFTEIAILLLPLFVGIAIAYEDWRFMFFNIVAPHTTYLMLLLNERRHQPTWFHAYFHHPMEIASRKWELELDNRPMFGWFRILMGWEK